MSRDRFDLVAVGNALVDYIHRVPVLPRCDGSALVLDRQTSAGGVEGNVAAAAARLGLRVGMIARIGNDATGTLVMDSFRDHGVDVARVHVSDNEETAYSLVFVDERGDRVIMTGGRGVFGLSLDDTDIAYARSARVCFASAYASWPILKDLAQCCVGGHGPAFAFDLSAEFEDLEPRGLQRAHIDALIPTISLFLTNRQSLRSYTGAESLPDGVACLCAKGVRRGSVSDAERGLYLFVAEASSDVPAIVHVPAFRVPVVDTTGAGDVLHAALIASWMLDNHPIPVAGRFAAAAAALSCQGWGVRSALPSRAEVEALAATR
jgi:sulfofructose kinase